MPRFDMIRSPLTSRYSTPPPNTLPGAGRSSLAGQKWALALDSGRNLACQRKKASSCFFASMAKESFNGKPRRPNHSYRRESVFFFNIQIAPPQRDFQSKTEISRDTREDQYDSERRGAEGGGNLLTPTLSSAAAWSGRTLPQTV